ncbi:MAG: anaerobic ribonucleoside-triphosphate reductase activating protein [Clostridiaceae bacterium]|nr:anaerobic ribonucleoside-triphosphate reductase activating protein [Clostridiaceae bacterium]
MQIRLYGRLKESITDGPGIRYAVFTQGCPHQCPSCHNPDSHDFTAGKLVDTEELLTDILANPLLDGLTLSGGEPFMQPEECAWLAAGARRAGLNVIVFSGYTWEELLENAATRRGWTNLLQETDILIDGRYEKAKRSLNLRFRGSSNQRAVDVQESLRQKQVILYPL